MNAANTILVMLVLLVTTAALETETPIVKTAEAMAPPANIEADAEWKLRTYGGLTDQSELAVPPSDPSVVIEDRLNHLNCHRSVNVTHLHIDGMHGVHLTSSPTTAHARPTLAIIGLQDAVGAVLVEIVKHMCETDSDRLAGIDLVLMPTLKDATHLCQDTFRFGRLTSELKPMPTGVRLEFTRSPEGGVSLKTRHDRTLVTFSRQSGHYAVPVAVGQYAVSASMDGYVTTTGPVTVAASQARASELHFNMHPVPVEAARLTTVALLVILAFVIVILLALRPYVVRRWNSSVKVHPEQNHVLYSTNTIDIRQINELRVDELH